MLFPVWPLLLYLWTTQTCCLFDLPSHPNHVFSSFWLAAASGGWRSFVVIGGALMGFVVGCEEGFCCFCSQEGTQWLQGCWFSAKTVRNQVFCRLYRLPNLKILGTHRTAFWERILESIQKGTQRNVRMNIRKFDCILFGTFDLSLPKFCRTTLHYEFVLWHRHQHPTKWPLFADEQQ